MYRGLRRRLNATHWWLQSIVGRMFLLSELDCSLFYSRRKFVLFRKVDKGCARFFIVVKRRIG